MSPELLPCSLRMLCSCQRRSTGAGVSSTCADRPTATSEAALPPGTISDAAEADRAQPITNRTSSTGGSVTSRRHSADGVEVDAARLDIGV